MLMKYNINCYADRCYSQIACADVVLLNKVDLVDEEGVSRLQRKIGACNPVAPVFRTIRGQIDLNHVIGLKAYSTRPFIQKMALLSKEYDLLSSHDHSDPDHVHLEGDRQPSHLGFTSIQVSCPALTVAQTVKLDEWIRTVLWEGHIPDEDQHEVEVLRCKGVYALQGGTLYVLQGVRNMYEISEVEESDIGIPDEGKLVFIGKSLDDIVRKSLLNVFR